MLHFGKIPKKLVKFSKARIQQKFSKKINSATFWQICDFFNFFVKNITSLFSASLRTICSRPLAEFFMFCVARSPFASPIGWLGPLPPSRWAFLFSKTCNRPMKLNNRTRKIGTLCRIRTPHNGT